MLDKMVDKIKSWTVKYLSYAGRLQLVQNVLMSIQNFWAQIFLISKKVLKKVEAIYKKFLQTGEQQHRGKTLIACDVVCRPKVTGGLNVAEVNKVAILKLM